MDTKLSENIRRYRKERSLTQGQLAEMLGVTVGAVYKWEAGLSIPELGMIVELADFFNTSVDALLGHEMKDNGLNTTLERLKFYIDAKECAGIQEAENALKRYPNIFWIVFLSAQLFYIIGSNEKDKELLMRSLELFRKSCTLISEVNSPKINETTISGDIALVYIALGENEKAVEVMQKNNIGGIYDHYIGQRLVWCDRFDEAEDYLSHGFLKGIVSVLNTLFGYTFLYIRKTEYNRAEEILALANKLVPELCASDVEAPNYFDRLTGIALMLQGYVKLRQGKTEEAHRLLILARDTAARFDEVPNYSIGAIPFLSGIKNEKMDDILGKTATESLENCCKEINDHEFDELWKKITDRHKLII